MAFAQEPSFYGVQFRPMMPAFVPAIGKTAKFGFHVCVAAAGSGMAGCITNPIDVIKTEMQLASKAPGCASAALPGVVGTLRARIASRGVRSLWAGVPVMIVKCTIYAGIRVGAYE